MSENESNIHRNDEVLKNLQEAKGISSGEAYAYAFGWCWAMLPEEHRATLLAKTEKMVKDKK